VDTIRKTLQNITNNEQTDSNQLNVLYSFYSVRIQCKHVLNVQTIKLDIRYIGIAIK